MKNTSQVNFSPLFYGIIFSLLSLYVIGAYFENFKLINMVQVLFVPIFLVYFLVKNSTINLPVIAFMLFAFFSDSMGLIMENYNIVKASSIFCFFAYICLIGINLKKFNLFETDKIIGIYLIGVLSINAYFLLILYGLLNAIVPDSLETILFGVKSASLIVLSFLSLAVYLNKQTKSSFLFFMAVVCLVFGSILNYVGLYYIYDWSVLALEKIMYVIGLYLLGNYIIKEKTETRKLRYNENNIFA